MIVLRLLVSGFLWSMSGIGLLAGAGMAWSLAISLAFPELTAQGAAVACSASPPFVGLAVWAWRQQVPLAVKIIAIISASIFTAYRTGTVFCFSILAIAQQLPASITQRPPPPAHSSTQVPGGGVAEWQRGTVVAPNKKERRGSEALRDSSKEAPKPEAPTPLPPAPRWPTDVLAAALGLEPATLYLAISALFAVALECTTVMGAALGTSVWRARVVQRQPDAEPTAPAVQAMMFITMALGWAMGAGRQPAHARTEPLHAAPARPNPVAGGKSTVAHPRQARRQRASQEDTTRNALDLLQRGLQGGVMGIEVQADGSLMTTNRRLAVLIGCGPGAVNVSLHWLEARGEIALMPSRSRTGIRMLRPAPAEPG